MAIWAVQDKGSHEQQLRNAAAHEQDTGGFTRELSLAIARIDNYHETQKR